MGCLQVVSRFAASPGFDLELGMYSVYVCVVRVTRIHIYSTQTCINLNTHTHTHTLMVMQ